VRDTHGQSVETKWSVSGKVLHPNALSWKLWFRATLRFDAVAVKITQKLYTERAVHNIKDANRLIYCKD